MGFGIDDSGDFKMTGNIDENNEVVMNKEYFGKESVIYRG